MKIELDVPSADLNMIQSYSDGGIIINHVTYTDSIIVCPSQTVESWPVQRPAELAIGHFLPLLDMAPELVLLGTGKRLQFPEQQILSLFLSVNIGIEVMDTAAACRAYNFIAGEGRKVVAALLSLDS